MSKHLLRRFPNVAGRRVLRAMIDGPHRDELSPHVTLRTRDSRPSEEHRGRRLTATVQPVI